MKRNSYGTGTVGALNLWNGKSRKTTLARIMGCFELSGIRQRQLEGNEAAISTRSVSSVNE